MPPTKICGKDVPPCVTIDATDNTALNEARAAFPDAYCHTDNKTVVSNLLQCLQYHSDAKSIMIIGHGAPGTIITGGGTEELGPFKFISYRNPSGWQSELGKLANHKLTAIILCSCNTGARDMGARLLFKVALKTKVMTFAYTGAITVTAQGDVSCQDGGQWQCGDPLATAPRPGINPPPLFLKDTDMNLKLIHRGDYRTIDISSVFSFSYYKADARGRGRLIFSQDEDAEGFLSLINFSDPFELKGEPLAIISGELEIECRIDEEKVQKSFIIYNDLLVRDASYPTIFYRASPDLANALLDFVSLRP